eukprot:907095-Pyramimonas_sp.AAC.2
MSMSSLEGMCYILAPWAAKLPVVCNCSHPTPQSGIERRRYSCTHFLSELRKVFINHNEYY